MKRLTYLIMAMIMMLSLGVTLQAAERKISVLVGDMEVEFLDGVGAKIVDGRTLVPLRGVFEALGFDVTWDSPARTAFMVRGDTVVAVKQGEPHISINGQNFLPEVPPQTIDGRLMLPLRAIAEATGDEVIWDSPNDQVIIIPAGGDESVVKRTREIRLNQNAGVNEVIGIGENVKFTVVFIPENATNKKVSWESADPSIVDTNKSSGKSTGKAEGTTTVTVTSESGGLTATATITVVYIPVEGLSIANDVSVRVGANTNVKTNINPQNASNTTLNWISSDPGIVTVQNDKGKVTGVQEGVATVTAVSECGGFSDTVRVTVLPKVVREEKEPVEREEREKVHVPVESLSISGPDVVIIGDHNSISLNAEITPRNASNKTVSWETSNADIATVTRGKVTGHKEGTVTITAIVDGKSSSKTLQVVWVALTSMTIDNPNIIVPLGGNINVDLVRTPHNASNIEFLAATPQTDVITLQPRSGTGMKINGNKEGTAIVECISVDGGFRVTLNIQVIGTPVETIDFNNERFEVEKGKSVNIRATVSPKNATDKSLTWTSSNPSIATVNNGKVQGLEQGVVTITATSACGRISKSAVVEVTYIPLTGIDIN